jgi:hypothetical protein
MSNCRSAPFAGCCGISDGRWSCVRYSSKAWRRSAPAGWAMRKNCTARCCACCERPCSRNASECCNKVAPPHGLALRPTATPYHTGCTLCITARLAADVRIGSKGEILAKSRCFPLCPQQRTSLNRVGMSVRCQERTSQVWSARSEALRQRLKTLRPCAGKSLLADTFARHGHRCFGAPSAAVPIDQPL